MGLRGTEDLALLRDVLANVGKELQDSGENTTQETTKARLEDKTASSAAANSSSETRPEDLGNSNKTSLTENLSRFEIMSAQNETDTEESGRMAAAARLVMRRIGSLGEGRALDLARALTSLRLHLGLKDKRKERFEVKRAAEVAQKAAAAKEAERERAKSAATLDWAYRDDWSYPGEAAGLGPVQAEEFKSGPALDWSYRDDWSHSGEAAGGANDWSYSGETAVSGPEPAPKIEHHEVLAPGKASYPTAQDSTEGKRGVGDFGPGTSGESGTASGGLKETDLASAILLPTEDEVLEALTALARALGRAGDVDDDAAPPRVEGLFDDGSKRAAVPAAIGGEAAGKGPTSRRGLAALCATAVRAILGPAPFAEPGGRAGGSEWAARVKAARARRGERLLLEKDGESAAAEGGTARRGESAGRLARRRAKWEAECRALEEQMEAVKAEMAMDTTEAAELNAEAEVGVKPPSWGSRGIVKGLFNILVCQDSLNHLI